MLRRAKMLFALLFAPVIALAISGGAVAEEAKRWESQHAQRRYRSQSGMLMTFT